MTIAKWPAQGGLAEVSYRICAYRRSMPIGMLVVSAVVNHVVLVVFVVDGHFMFLYSCCTVVDLLP